MPKFLMLGVALFLLLAAADYGLTTIQARSIPWDCADWQAFAHDDRTTAILESLAENRARPSTAASTSPIPLPKPKLGKPAKTAMNGMTPSISASAASSAALSPPRRVI